MPVDRKLLDILCCPVSHSPLMMLSAERLDRLNSAISDGDIIQIGGEKVETSLDEALITQDGRVIYPVSDAIPILLEEQGIGTKQIQEF